MRFEILSLIALTGAVLAAPHATPDAVAEVAPVQEWEVTQVSAPLTKRTPGGMFLCTDIHFLGTCGYAVQPLNQCIGLDSPWWHSVSSMGPDSGAVCDIYSDFSCQTIIYRSMRNPGSSDMTQIGINDQMGSFKCRSG